MRRKIVSRSDLARLAGVSPAAVTKQCRPGGALAEGCVRDRVDMNAECVQKWLSGHAGGTTGSAPRRKKTAAEPTARGRKTGKSPPPAADLLEDLSAYMGLTLGEIIARHGTIRELKDLLEARAKIAAIQERELGMSESRAELVDRNLVRLHVIGAFDAAHRRLLSDAVETLARRLYAACKAGESLEDGKRLAREVVSAHLDLAKVQAAKALQDA